MIDYFALFQEQRRPWIDSEALKEKFLSISAAVHPDRVHSAIEAERALASARYSELNAGYQCLRSHKDRLLHLLQLEHGAKPKEIERIPPEMMEFFLKLGPVLRDVDAVLNEKSRVLSPLLKVQWFEKGMQWTEILQSLQREIDGQQEKLLDELRGMNSVWQSAPAIGDTERARTLPLARVEEIYRKLGYFQRWTSQIRERIARLAF